MAGINRADASLAASSSSWLAACAHALPLHPNRKMMIKTRTQLRGGRARSSLIRLHPLVVAMLSKLPIIVRLPGLQCVRLLPIRKRTVLSQDVLGKVDVGQSLKNAGVVFLWIETVLA
jgi:hypothetical protein